MYQVFFTIKVVQLVRTISYLKHISKQGLTLKLKLLSLGVRACLHTIVNGAVCSLSTLGTFAIFFGDAMLPVCLQFFLNYQVNAVLLTEIYAI